MTAITRALSKAVKAAPASSIRMGLDLRLTSDRITAPVASPATRAAIGRAIPGSGSRKAMMVATAREAPAETPINSGPARGLRRVSCITAPEAPSMAPDTTAPITRGRRRFRTMNWRFPSDSEPKRASKDLADRQVGGSLRERHHGHHHAQKGDGGHHHGRPYPTVPVTGVSHLREEGGLRAKETALLTFTVVSAIGPPATTPTGRPDGRRGPAIRR